MLKDTYLNYRLISWSLLSFIISTSIGFCAPNWLNKLIIILGIFVWAAIIVFKVSKKWLIIGLIASLGLIRGISSSGPTIKTDVATSVQNWTQIHLEESIGYPESALAAGLISGDRTQIPFSIKQDFRNSGLAHLLAVSGYNVTLVVSFIHILVKNTLPIRLRLLVNLLGIVGFVWFAGADTAVVRAGIMGGIASLALSEGRATASKRVILFAAALMVLFQPWLVLFDVSFQLSFAATLSIIFFSKRLNDLLSFLPDYLGVRTSLITTLAATLGTMPIVILVFKSVPTLGIIANLFAAPLVPLCMLFSAVCAILGSSFIGQIVGAIGGSIINWLLDLANFFAHLPGSVLTLENFFWSLISIVAVWLLFGCLILIEKKYKKSLKSQALLK